MELNREWVTPVTIGAFLISAVTGVAIFFHIDTGLAKFAHEWLSWLLLVAVLLHVGANLFGFKRYFTGWRSLTIIVASVLIVAGSFAVGGGGHGAGGPPHLRPARALAHAPLSLLAQVAKISPEELHKRLAAAKLPAPTSDEQSLSDLTGPDRHKQIHVMANILSKKK
ncbi:MAG: DUF4405 domain-containing protein [Alphaproteobacteria bacterium]